MRRAGYVAPMGEGRNVYRVLVGKPEGKRPLRRPGHRWEDGMEMVLREIGWWGGVDSPSLAGCGCVCSGFTWLRIGTVGVLS
jgi:hypothetical protein